MKRFTEKYGSVEVRALSTKQPFASLMLQGKIETRTWDSPYFGWVLICASALPYTELMVLEVMGQRQYERVKSMLPDIRDKKSKIGERLSNSFPLSQAIAVGRLVKSELIDNIFAKQIDLAYRHETIAKLEDKCFCKVRSGLWLHTYEDVQAIEPFHWSGQLGFKKLDQLTKDKIILL